MNFLLAANFSGMFEFGICHAAHAVFALLVLIYLIRLGVSFPQAGARGLPRWLFISTVSCVGIATWATFANKSSPEISLWMAKYLIVAPALYLLCGAGVFVSVRCQKRRVARLPAGR